MIGPVYADNVCLTSTGNCAASSFEFISILEESGFSTSDGILGLCPYEKTYSHNFLDKLHKSKVISKKMISLYLSLTSPTIMFGGYDSSMIKSGGGFEGKGIYWYELKGTTYWEIKIKGFSYGSNSLYSGTSNTAILDSGTSFIIVPTSEFTSFSSYIEAQSSSVICSGGVCTISSTCSGYY